MAFMTLFFFGRPKQNLQQNSSCSTARLAVIVVIIFLIASGASSACFAQKSSSDLDLHGTITYANRQTYVEFPFEVPNDVTRVTVEFSYTERDKHTSIDLGMFDGEHFRGWSGGNKSTFTVSATDATPSYLPGPIRPGKWKLILGVPSIREGVRSEYEAKIHFSRAGDRPDVSTFSH